jgi:hypothetical protein
MKSRSRPTKRRPEVRIVPPLLVQTSEPAAASTTIDDSRCGAMQEIWSTAYDGEDVTEALHLLNANTSTGRVQQPAHIVELTIDDVETHVSQCPTCSAVAQATVPFRRLRIRTADPTLADLRPAIRAALANDRVAPPLASRSSENPLRPSGRRSAMAPAILIALMVTGVAQVLGALPDLFGSLSGGLSSSVSGLEHLTREAAASEIALAAGFIYVTWKPFAVAAVRLFASVFTLLVILSALTSNGVTRGAVPLETHHLIALFGTTLLWLLPTNLSTRSPWGIQEGSHNLGFAASSAPSLFPNARGRGIR